MERAFSNYEIHKDLLDFILQEKTGFFHMQPGDRKLFFEKGHLVFAKSGEKGENFADILVEMGKISEDQLEELKIKLQPGESLGKALREKGFANPQDLGTSLKHQIMRIITKVILGEEGTLQIHTDELPQKMPRLKISTLPLFVKNILLIESPGFPQGMDQPVRIAKTEAFDSVLEKLNLPEHYDNYIQSYDSILTNKDHQDDLEEDVFKKLTYLFHIMGMLDFEPIPESENNSHTDPFDQLGFSDDSGDLLDEDGEMFDLEEAAEGEELLMQDGEPGLEDFDPMSDMAAESQDREELEPIEEEPFESLDMAPETHELRDQNRDWQDPEPYEANDLDLPSAELDDSPFSDEPLDDLEDSSFEDPLSEEADLPDQVEPLLNDEPESLEDPFEEQDYAPDVDPLEAFGSAQGESPLAETDPIEALNRALEETETPDYNLYEDSAETELDETLVMDDQHETVPGEPIDELRQQFRESNNLPLDELSDGPTVPGDFTASDLAPTQPMDILDPDATLEKPTDHFPAEFESAGYEEEAPKPPERDLSKEFIMPDADADHLQFFEKKRTWPIFIIPAAIIVLAVFGFLFREKIPGVSSLFNSEPSTQSQEMAVPESVNPEENSKQIIADTDLEEPIDSEIPQDDSSDVTNSLDNNSESSDSSSTLDPNESFSENTSSEPSDAITSPQPNRPVAKEEKRITATDTTENFAPESQPETPEYKEADMPVFGGRSMDEVLLESQDAFNSKGQRFTLVYMVACQKETVEKHLEDHPDKSFFIIPRPSHGKMCYCLAWGRFPSWAEAKKASTQVPNDLSAGANPWVLKVN